jgi:hypothetical protein
MVFLLSYIVGLRWMNRNRGVTWSTLTWSRCPPAGRKIEPRLQGRAKPLWVFLPAATFQQENREKGLERRAINRILPLLYLYGVKNTEVPCAS